MRRLELIRRAVNAPFRPLGLAVVHRSALQELRRTDRRAVVPGALPQGAGDVLRRDHPKLAEYERRYSDHPAAHSSVWSADHVRRAIDLPYFRRDNALLWQSRGASEVRYGLTAYYTRRHDDLGLFDRLTEDGLFGADTYVVDDVVVSRDLLDSIAELKFLDEELGISTRATTVLDIGAGYGRLAHRGAAAFEDLNFVCVDAVPISTFLCEYYLSFRGVKDRARTVPLDEVEESTEARSANLAVNIHSFSECPLTTIEWWLDLLATTRATHLMIVPNTRDRLLSTERSGRRLDFMPAVRARGFELVRKRPKYAHSDFVQTHGIYPSVFYLFRRAG